VLSHRGYGVSVVCDDNPLEEFNVKIESDNTVSCYIPSEQGKTFVIKLVDELSPENSTLAHGFLAKSMHCFMDGNNVGALFIQPGATGTCDGSPVGNFGVRPFIFSPIVTTDDDTLAAQNDSMHEKLGTIEVKLRRAIPGAAPSYAFSAQYKHDGPGVVHERSKKAGSHQVGFGAIQARPQNFVQPNYFDHDFHVTFRFFYRSRGILQAQGIINVAPPPNAQASGSKAGVKRERSDSVIVITDSEDESIRSERKPKISQTRKRARKELPFRAKLEPGLSTGDVIDLS